MNSAVEDFSFGLVVFLGLFFLHSTSLLSFVFIGNTVFKAKYLPLPDTLAKAL